MARHDANPDRFSRNVDRAVQDRRQAAADERARRAATTRVESSRGDR